MKTLEDKHILFIIELRHRIISQLSKSAITSEYETEANEILTKLTDIQNRGTYDSNDRMILSALRQKYNNNEI